MQLRQCLLFRPQKWEPSQPFPHHILYPTVQCNADMIVMVVLKLMEMVMKVKVMVKKMKMLMVLPPFSPRTTNQVVDWGTGLPVDDHDHDCHDDVADWNDDGYGPPCRRAWWWYRSWWCWVSHCRPYYQDRCFENRHRHPFPRSLSKMLITKLLLLQGIGRGRVQLLNIGRRGFNFYKLISKHSKVVKIHL